MKPINNTTIQKYYRALSALFNWSINEDILETSSLVKIKVPRAEKKVIKALDSTEVSQLISSFRHTFATMWLKNGGDSLMLQRLLGHTTLMMTNRYCQAVGCYDAVEAHKRYSPVDRLRY